MRNQMLFCSNFSFLEDSYLILKQKACFITFSNFYISCDVISKIKLIMPCCLLKLCLSLIHSIPHAWDNWGGGVLNKLLVRGSSALRLKTFHPFYKPRAKNAPFL